MPTHQKRIHLSLAIVAIATLAACNATTGGVKASTQFAGAAQRQLALDNPEQLVTQQFDRSAFTAASAEELIARCLPGLTAPAVKSMAKDWKFDAQTTVRQNLRGASYLVYQNGFSVCIARNSGGSSIYPAQAFEDTMVPEGISAETRADWMMQIARFYARWSLAKVAYALPDGRTRIVEYSSDASTPSSNSLARETLGKLPYSMRDVTGPLAEKVDLSFSGQGLTLVIPKAYAGSYAKGPFDKP
jgi:hypothetical protein